MKRLFNEYGLTWINPRDIDVLEEMLLTYVDDLMAELKAAQSRSLGIMLWKSRKERTITLKWGDLRLVAIWDRPYLYLDVAVKKR